MKHILNMPDSLEVCRLCLSKEGLMLPIFQTNISKNETSFRTKIMSCASIEVYADDDLPSKICYLCVYQVEKFFQFQAMCENSDLVLRSQLKESKVLHDVDHDEKNICVPQNTEDKDEKYSLMQSYSSTHNERKQSFDVLTCSICGSVFLTNNHLIDHLIKNHSDLNFFFCKSCKTAFSHVNQFKNHLNVQHSLTCNHCTCVFKYEKSLKDHLKIHIGESIVCKSCGKAFHSFYDLKRHELVHSEKTCNYCTKELDSKADCNSHFKECDLLHHCKICEQAFKLKKDLIEHVNSEHDSSGFEKCDSCIDTKMPIQIKEHKIEAEDKSLEHKNESSLLKQISTEPQCSVLTCRFCTKKFTLKSSLKRHEKSHSGIKPYQCKFCPRKFKDSGACVVHTRTHTGEHPFRCQECHKDFKQLANLKMHTFRHHKKSKKSAEVKSEILNESGNGYQHLYNESGIENYSEVNMRGYQVFNETVSSGFNQDINILIPGSHSS